MPCQPQDTVPAPAKFKAMPQTWPALVNGTIHPASAGSIIGLFATGGGALTTDTLPRVALPVSATMGGLDVQVLYAGVAPGEPEGVIQINVQVPSGLTPGSAQIVVKIGDASTQPGATLTVK